MLRAHETRVKRVRAEVECCDAYGLQGLKKQVKLASGQKQLAAGLCVGPHRKHGITDLRVSATLHQGLPDPERTAGRCPK